MPLLFQPAQMFTFACPACGYVLECTALRIRVKPGFPVEGDGGIGSAGSGGGDIGVKSAGGGEDIDVDESASGEGIGVDEGAGEGVTGVESAGDLGVQSAGGAWPFYTGLIRLIEERAAMCGPQLGVVASSASPAPAASGFASGRGARTKRTAGGNPLPLASLASSVPSSAFAGGVRKKPASGGNPLSSASLTPAASSSVSGGGVRMKPAIGGNLLSSASSASVAPSSASEGGVRIKPAAGGNSLSSGSIASPSRSASGGGVRKKPASGGNPLRFKNLRAALKLQAASGDLQALQRLHKRSGTSPSQEVRRRSRAKDNRPNHHKRASAVVGSGAEVRDLSVYTGSPPGEQRPDP